MAADKFPIEAGHIMMFARSIGDANEIYYDEDYAKSTEPGCTIAPPTFVQASAQFDPNYFLRPKIG
ncbi:MAG TPA: MaoC family dehydratase N-terminal domain-containing protein, partial [Pseudomonadales bacterium]|nr:MaoC family dehydratase N-terminal domain-containing protein [Pseudomonadales bacterium]